MNDKRVLNTLASLTLLFWIGLNVGCDGAPASGTPSVPVTRPQGISSQATPAQGTTVKNSIPVVAPKTSSDLTVIYLPYHLGEEGGLVPYCMQEFLQQFQATGKPRLNDVYAKIITAEAQKDLLLGLLDSKGTPVKQSDGDSEILITRPSWDKSIIIDRYGVVTDGYRLYPNPISPEAEEKKSASDRAGDELRLFHLTPGGRMYRLTPTAMRQLVEWIKTAFPLNAVDVPMVSLDTGFPVMALHKPTGMTEIAASSL